MNKQNNSFIDSSILETVDNLFSNSAEFEKWVEYVKLKENNFYEWIQSKIGIFLKELSLNSNISLITANLIAARFFYAFLSGYVISYLIDEKKIAPLLRNKTTDEKIEDWLNGRMSSNFYKYSLKGLDKNSFAYKAKKAFMKNLERKKNGRNKKKL